jgi:hypothetical protein
MLVPDRFIDDKNRYCRVKLLRVNKNIFEVTFSNVCDDKKELQMATTRKSDKWAQIFFGLFNAAGRTFTTSLENLERLGEEVNPKNHQKGVVGSVGSWDAGGGAGAVHGKHRNLLEPNAWRVAMLRCALLQYQRCFGYNENALPPFLMAKTVSIFEAGVFQAFLPVELEGKPYTTIQTVLKAIRLKTV